jgi:hypothetical protein
MAHALPGARSILCVRATRTRDGTTTSNIVWNYGNCTIPRHLRDIVITEYGIADLRGKTDEETIAALLNIADSRFQQTLLSQAKAAGKIASDHRIPEAFTRNTPGKLEEALSFHRRAGLFTEYPFGTDLTTEEIQLAKALRRLQADTRGLRGKLRTIAAAVLRGGEAANHASLLRRLGLAQPRSLRDRLLRRMISVSLAKTGSGR